MSDSLRVAIARATWEQWRTLDIAATSCRDLSFDELVELAEAPPLARTRRNPAAVILEAGLMQADAALAAIKASGTHVVVPVEPTEEMVGEFARVMWRDQRPYETTGEQVGAVYSAMLAARPRDAAPTGESDGC